MALDDWETKAAELRAAGIPIPPDYTGNSKSYTLPAATYNQETPEAGSISVLWTLSTLYVVSVVNPDGVTVNKKNGCNLAKSKFGQSWKSAWKAAKYAAGWTDSLQG